MAKRENYESRAEAILEPIVAANNCEIYDVEYIKEGSDWYLRAYIDKPEGVNIVDCENVSRAFSEKLDQEDFIPDAYILEVSSPGLGRTLKKDRHLTKSIGEEVEVRLYKPLEVENNKGKTVKQKEFVGILKGFDKDTITIEVEDENKKDDSEARTNEMIFARSDIAIIRLTLDF
ncbi:MAG: ribosome maturation factor RimP [Lachnospiraceae bacterium]|nr:ribosome maturation factor RimP [Lachnospiraceae bacterium]MBQ2116565.1 ribosome maturation factor RimP [Lachnospiraceae bacterium]MBQ2405341.1 ribosome maturation factor RimP [Lachnospiraceae bacterium]MBQ5852229.1 ribosome maturation factor RimP [Lachnospiraceae bacterium]MEE0919313.1 ribosome maturation factor RimP [Lachnospiraceae bacterium]